MFENLLKSPHVYDIIRETKKPMFKHRKRRQGAVTDGKKYPNITRVVSYYSSLTRPMESLAVAVEYLRQDRPDADEGVGLTFGEVMAGGDQSRLKQQLG